MTLGAMPVGMGSMRGSDALPTFLASRTTPRIFAKP
jgi:hypothetical protein